jgi:serine/threonine protein kinase
MDVSPLPGWNPIIHLDIKDANIFLGTPTDPYRGYLTPLLADFGLSADMATVALRPY